MNRVDRNFAWLSLATAISVALGLWQWRSSGDRGAVWIAALTVVCYATACVTRVWYGRVERRYRAWAAKEKQELDAALTEIARTHAGRAKRAGGGDA